MWIFGFIWKHMGKDFCSKLPQSSNGQNGHLIPPLFWILRWLFINNIEINLKSSKKCQINCFDNSAKLSSRIVRDHWPHFKIFWKWICPLQYFLRKMLIALFYISIMILRLKATWYVNLAIILCLFLDTPTTLGTSNLVMSTYSLR